MHFEHSHLNYLKEIPFIKQGPVGLNAKSWASYFMHNQEIDNSLNNRFDRLALSNYVKNLDYSTHNACIAILAWGGMNRKHGQLIFKAKESWLPLAEDIRNKKITHRKMAYNGFMMLKRQGKLPGMGPAYFTKLICFLNPELNAYIMDQWIAKSINLLAGKNIVPLTNSGLVKPQTGEVVYEEFCSYIEILCQLLKMTALETEELLFSHGGYKKGQWRAYVIDQWKNEYRQMNKNIPTNHVINELPENLKIEYSEVLEFFTNKLVEIPTLKKQSAFKLSRKGEYLQIITTPGKKYNVNEDLWNKVLGRINELPADEKIITSCYSTSVSKYRWDSCPDQVISPYIPAIVRYYLNR